MFIVQVYTEFRPPGYFKNETNWDYYKDLLNRAADTSTSTYHGYTATVKIDKDTTLPEFKANIGKI